MSIKNVCFTGSQGTGKTTLRELLVKNNTLDISTVLPSAVRSLIKEGQLTLEEINLQTTIHSQSMIFNMQCEHHKLYNDIPYISDRSPVDVLAYTLWMLERSNKDAKCYEIINTYDKYYEHYDIVKNLILDGYINTIFYVPIEFEITGDEVRIDDKKFQSEIDNNIKFILKELFQDCGDKLNIFEITGSVEEREQQMLNIFEKYA